MYKKILAPLDGSELAECSLQHVQTIATGCRVPEVVLLRIVEPISPSVFTAIENIGEFKVDDIYSEDKAAAQSYLSQVSDELRKDGISNKVSILAGKPAEEILNYAKNNSVDLIIMSTHGRSGVVRWAFGSVTDKVLRHSVVPVLTVSPSSCRNW